MKLWDRIKLFFGVRRDMRRIRSQIPALNNITPPDINKFNMEEFQAYCEASKLDLMEEIAKSNPELFEQPEESLLEKMVMARMAQFQRENSTGHDSPEKQNGEPEI